VGERAATQLEPEQLRESAAWIEANRDGLAILVGLSRQFAMLLDRLGHGAVWNIDAPPWPYAGILGVAGFLAVGPEHQSSCKRSPSMRKCSDFSRGLSAVRVGIRSARA
jgi:hypothetical protein